MKLKTLSIFTGVLFIISLFVYSNENKRGTDLLTGSDYVKGLDINKIQKISLSFSGDKKITFTRDANKFVLENHKSYPASTDKINDLIYKIASIQVKEKITSNANDSDLSKFELNKEKRKYLVELFDNDGKKTVAFSVGKSYKGKGNYLLREGKDEVYLSKKSLWINSSYKDFINTVLFDVKKNDIEKISLSSDKDIEILKKDKEFVVEHPSDFKFKKEKVEEYTKNFSFVKFNDFYPVTDSKVKSLKFDKNVKLQLKNKLIYKISLAHEKDEHFVKLSALLEEAPKKFVVRQDDGKEELQKIEDVIKAQGEAQKINIERGVWVYKVDKSVYEKLAKNSKFFL